MLLVVWSMSSPFAKAAFFGPAPLTNAVERNRSDSTLCAGLCSGSSFTAARRCSNKVFLADFDLMAVVETLPKKTVRLTLSDSVVALFPARLSCCGKPSGLLIFETPPSSLSVGSSLPSVSVAFSDSSMFLPFCFFPLLNCLLASSLASSRASLSR